MKNPMTLQQKHQALDDNEAGKPMQTLSFMDSNATWRDRDSDFVGADLSFDSLAYRRKPRTSEDILKMAVAWWLGDGKQKFIGAPAWVFDARALLELEEKNPWRPIIRSEWPECKRRKQVRIRYHDGAIRIVNEEDVRSTSAIEWCHVENEK